jgi:hypothetical protein
MEFEPGSLLHGRIAETRATLIDINYHTPIDVNDTADIEASVRQQGAGAGSEYELKALDWPVTLRLDGPGLEWTEHDIPIKEGTPLPVTEHWVPRAKAAGWATLITLPRATASMPFRTQSKLRSTA